MLYENYLVFSAPSNGIISFAIGQKIKILEQFFFPCECFSETRNLEGQRSKSRSRSESIE